MDAPTSLAVVYPLLAVLGLAGVYEYRCYTPEQRAEAPVAARVLLATWLLAITVGVVGTGLLLSGAAFTWQTFLVVMAFTIVGPLAQFRLHRQVRIDRSPLVDRFL